MANAGTRRIRFVDLREAEIYNIVENGDSLSISFMNGDMELLKATFQDSENCAVLQYYVGYDLFKAYNDFVVYVSIKEDANVLISKDETVVDDSTPSGYAEVRADIQTVTIRKRTTDERLRILEKAMGV